MTTIYERVKKVVAKQLGVEEEQVTPEASFVDDLGADSLDLVELVMALEDEFSNPERKFQIPDKDAQNLRTIQDVVNYLKERDIEDED